MPIDEKLCFLPLFLCLCIVVVAHILSVCVLVGVRVRVRTRWLRGQKLAAASTTTILLSSRVSCQRGRGGCPRAVRGRGVETVILFSDAVRVPMFAGDASTSGGGGMQQRMPAPRAEVLV